MLSSPVPASRSGRQVISGSAMRSVVVGTTATPTASRCSPEAVPSRASTLASSWSAANTTRCSLARSFMVTDGAEASTWSCRTAIDSAVPARRVRTRSPASPSPTSGAVADVQRTLPDALHPGGRQQASIAHRNAERLLGV
ncbi:hypothetical protein [Streptomyces sp. A5-4]|uniref:hypothetical protein n=1 Tax=Streptomyces sp. A5-4 TaxID=3384771 RepID=UPI003DA9882F